MIKKVLETVEIEKEYHYCDICGKRIPEGKEKYSYFEYQLAYYGEDYEQNYEQDYQICRECVENKIKPLFD